MKIQIDKLSIDPLAKTVTVNNIPVDLTRKEFELLYYLATNRNKVISKHVIAEHISNTGNAYHDSLDFIYSHVKNLKRKLARAGCRDHIRSVYGMGYKFIE
jgi:DNA-binding response OmpR family regulator